MQDAKWIGASPANPYWSADNKYLLFNWNPEKATNDSLYYITTATLTPQKTNYSFRKQIVSSNAIRYNAGTAYVYVDNGDIFMADIKTGNRRRITQTAEAESAPQFSFNNTKVVFTRAQNLYAWEINTGATIQLTNFQSAPATPGAATAGPPRGNQPPLANRGNRTADSRNPQEKWLQEEALNNSIVLQNRKARRELDDSMRKLFTEKPLRIINIDDRTVAGASVSNDGRFISYRLNKTATGTKTTIVPSYVTESGYTEDIASRAKVGAAQNTQELFVFDTMKDTVLPVKTDSVPGIRDLPEYLKDYQAVYAERSKRPLPRSVTFLLPAWSPANHYAIVEMRAQDNKDRWLLLLDAATMTLSLLDRQHDSAWIGGPGINNFAGNNAGWINNNTYWFQSEATGYSHIYTINITTGERKALTSGRYEVMNADLSKDKKYFYITTNEVHPGEQQFYRLPVTGGKAERITTMTGGNQVRVSPDEKWISVLYSYSNKPPELYLQENKPGGKIQQVTTQAQSAAFKTYAWRDPEIVTFAARDGATVYARLYQPSQPHPAKPAVIFVHGAGYLQNVHKYWSSYFREYMFNNFLADNGYTVLDIDYRGSSGYGRDWRTGIYRFMGGKDLSDHIDGARYLVEKQGVNPKHIGIYGGSYGGFITLMALFTEPGVFEAGAALRSVTDWAHYNHGYTANILNEPFTDSLAYYRSSPINFAAGLKGHLLMCHGMVDVNVHFQDIIRLSQKLIELGKNDWELAVYPVEDHAFVEPSSWTDEYKRIFKLFETWLKR
jgi:dipeptidyl aminopeptidase/acylaminoacyl peptidase